MPAPTKLDTSPFVAACTVWLWFDNIDWTFPLPSSNNTNVTESLTAALSPIAVTLTDVFVPKLSFVNSILVKSSNEPVFNVTVGVVE